jgi:hypothetical protein
VENNQVTIESANDAAPFALGIAAVLARSAEHEKLRRRLERMRGVLALRSATDLQKAVVRFDRGRITVANGSADDADVTITLDPNDASVKPKVEGAAKHLVFALNVAKVMEPPTGTWRTEAERFWAFASGTPRMPDRLRVVCTDDGSEMTLGAADGSVYEIHAPASALISVFSGSSIIGQEMLDMKLRVVGSMEHASILTGRSIALTLGTER